MKKLYENVQLELVFFTEEDVIRTSQKDDTADFPDFPENFG